MCRTGRGSISQAERWNVQDGSRRVWIMNSLSLTCLLCTPPPPFHKTWILKDVIGPAVATIQAEVCRRRWRLTDWYDKPSVFFLFICFFLSVHLPNTLSSDLCNYACFFLSRWGMTGRGLVCRGQRVGGEKLLRVVWTWARRRRRGKPSASTSWVRTVTNSAQVTTEQRYEAD